MDIPNIIVQIMPIYHPMLKSATLPNLSKAPASKKAMMNHQQSSSQIPSGPKGSTKSNSSSAPKSIPRPRNCWIIYCSQNRTDLPTNISTTEKTKILAEKWQNESDEVKSYYSRLAEEEERLHREKYPDYRYRPTRKKDKKNTRSEKHCSTNACLNDDDDEQETVKPRARRSSARSLKKARFDDGDDPFEVDDDVSTRHFDQQNSHSNDLYNLLVDHPVQDDHLNTRDPVKSDFIINTLFTDDNTLKRIHGGDSMCDNGLLLSPNSFTQLAAGLRASSMDTSPTPASATSTALSPFDFSTAALSMHSNPLSTQLVNMGQVSNASTSAGLSFGQSLNPLDTTRFDFGLPSPNELDMNSISHSDVKNNASRGAFGMSQSGFSNTTVTTPMFPISPADDLFHSFLDARQSGMTNSVGNILLSDQEAYCSMLMKVQMQRLQQHQAQQQLNMLGSALMISATPEELGIMASSFGNTPATTPASCMNSSSPMEFMLHDFSNSQNGTSNASTNVFFPLMSDNLLFFSDNQPSPSNTSSTETNGYESQNTPIPKGNTDDLFPLFSQDYLTCLSPAKQQQQQSGGNNGSPKFMSKASCQDQKGTLGIVDDECSLSLDEWCLSFT